MADFPIPDVALGQHLAVLGKTGSGKTTTEKAIIEHVVAEGFRVCVLDPIKSDWWGVTSSADGKRPGLPFHILGGPRGHVPLDSSAGDVVGRLVAEGALPLSIVDMADFEPGGLQRFFVDFAQALMRHMQGVLYLVVEEAHEFAPKERSGIGAETHAIHWAKKLATAGRSKGIRLIVASQRTQALHNAVLGSCETLIAHRLIAPADQKPVLDWLKTNIADKAQREEIAGSLSSLPTGTAWICSGEADLRHKVQIPRIGTFDNTATPTRDRKRIEVRTAAVDVAQLRQLLGVRIGVDLASGEDITATVLMKPDPAALKAAEDRGYARGKADGQREEWARAHQAAAARIDAGIQTLLADLRAERPPEAKTAAAAPQIAPQPIPATAAPKTAAAPTAAPAAPPEAPGDLTGPQQNVLRSMAWWRAMGKDTPTRNQVATICGWSTNSSNIRDRVGELVRKGLVDRPASGQLRLTPAGVAAAPEPEQGVTLVDRLRSILTAPQRQVFEVLYANQQAMTRDDVATRIGWSTTSSNIRDRIGDLVRLDVVERPGPGWVGLQSWVRA